jgi:DNA polymerase III alpha subunit
MARCSPICPRRSRTPSRSPAAAPSPSASTSRSCRVFADDEVEELRRQAWDGLRARLAIIPHAVPVEEYEERLRFELGIIEQMGFPGYFLIVADFIKWAKDHGIPGRAGPGLGGGLAGRLCADHHRP